MIHGVGTDIADVNRIKTQIDKDADFQLTFLTTAESNYCMSKASWAQNIAGRYAAKEAFFKALGTGWRDGMSFTDIEIINDERGRPYVELHNQTKEYCDQIKIAAIHVSISHLRDFATAIVVLETNR